MLHVVVLTTGTSVSCPSCKSCIPLIDLKIFGLSCCPLGVGQALAVWSPAERFTFAFLWSPVGRLCHTVSDFDLFLRFLWQRLFLASGLRPPLGFRFSFLG